MVLDLEPRWTGAPHPPKISRLHFVFDGWEGDQLVTTFPCYLVTTSFAELFEKQGISGFKLGEAEMETSEEFTELYPGLELPSFQWLKINGHPEDSDIFMTTDNRLGVSRKALDLVLSTNPQNLDFREAT